MKLEHEWQLKTPEERNQALEHLVEDNERVMRGEKPRYRDEYCFKASDSFEQTTPRETVGNLYGKSPDEYGKTDEEIREMRREKEGVWLLVA
jgi:hypothetical protein